MTQAEKDSVPNMFDQHVKSRPMSPNHLKPLSYWSCSYAWWAVYELQETADKLEYIMMHHTNMLAGIAYNQVVLDNHLTHLKNLLTNQFSEVHQKLGDIIHLRSLTC